jgi:hypothetical protein
VAMEHSENRDVDVDVDVVDTPTRLPTGGR